MTKKGPIILVDDDKDDCEILEYALSKLSISNPLLCFPEGETLISYLKSTTERPFLILCDINMPSMNGIELRKKIDTDEHLRKKSIPFVFYTTSANPFIVGQAYEMSVQGFFQKENKFENIAGLIKVIYDYWQLCKHPND